MRTGRARWRIENETFNTLKNQGYNLEHMTALRSYGLGKEHLSAVFVHLMILAFLVDQVQQLCCPLFQAARNKCRCKSSLWEKMRALFNTFEMRSMAEILCCIAHGMPKQKPDIQWNRSSPTKLIFKERCLLQKMILEEWLEVASKQRRFSQKTQYVD